MFGVFKHIGMAEKEAKINFKETTYIAELKLRRIDLKYLSIWVLITTNVATLSPAPLNHEPK